MTRQQHHIQLLTAGLTGLLLTATACQRDADGAADSVSQPLPIVLTCCQVAVDGTEQTRAGLEEHTLLNGEQLNVYMPRSQVTTAMTYTVAAEAGGDGKSTLTLTSASTPYLYYSRTPVYGIYPTAATIDNVTDEDNALLSYSVQLDQSATDGDNYKLSDLMYATTSASRADASAAGVIAIDLQFHHLMSKIVVEVTGVPDEFTVTGIYLVTIGKTLQLNPSTYIVSHTSLTGLTTTNAAGTSATYSTDGIKLGTASGCAALVPPQEVSGQDFIVVEAQGIGSKAVHKGTVTYAVPQNETITLLPGRTYKVQLKMDTWDFGQRLNVTLSNWSNIDTPEDIGNPRLSV